LAKSIITNARNRCIAIEQSPLKYLGLFGGKLTEYETTWDDQVSSRMKIRIRDTALGIRFVTDENSLNAAHMSARFMMRDLTLRSKIWCMSWLVQRLCYLVYVYGICGGRMFWMMREGLCPIPEDPYVEEPTNQITYERILTLR